MSQIASTMRKASHGYDLGAAATRIFCRRRQPYSISKSTSSRQSRHILPKSVIFYLVTNSGD